MRRALGIGQCGVGEADVGVQLVLGADLELVHVEPARVLELHVARGRRLALVVAGELDTLRPLDRKSARRRRALRPPRERVLVIFEELSTGPEPWT